MALFELHAFTRSAATPGWEVLRIAGTWRAGRPQRLPYAWLVIDDGRRALRVTPAPAVAHPVADPAGAQWSAAFPLPSDLLAVGRLAFALRCGDVVTVDLPRPAPGTPEPEAADAVAADGGASAPHNAAEAARQREELEARVRSAEARARASERALEASRAALTLAEEARLERDRRDAAAATAQLNGSASAPVPVRDADPR